MVKKSNNKSAEKTTVTYYKVDIEIIKREDVNLGEINQTKFNLSAFLRHCLRDENILKEYRKTDSYLNQK